MPGHARVWIYQSKRVFSEQETAQLQAQLDVFTRQWASHQNPLAAAGNVLHNRFVVLSVDEQQVGASGCSIDTSVHFMQQLGQTFATDFFDRMTFAYRDQNEEIQVANRDTFAKLYQEGVLNDSTIVFDHLLQTVDQLNSQWEKPLGSSWHKRMV